MRRFLGLMMAGMILFSSGCERVTGLPAGGAVNRELTQAQRFKLKNIDGTVTDLSQVLMKKKLVLINFWATWCGFCVEEMPDLVKLQKWHEGEGFTVVAVNSGESAHQAAAFAAKFRLNFPVVLDEDNEISQSYGIVGIPVSYLVSSDGKILGEYHGFTRRLVSDIKKNLQSSQLPGTR